MTHDTVVTATGEIAWRPAPHGEEPPGHQRGWALEPLADDRTRVTDSHDFSDLGPEPAARLARARAMTPEKHMAPIDRLAELAGS